MSPSSKQKSFVFVVFIVVAIAVAIALLTLKKPKVTVSPIPETLVTETESQPVTSVRTSIIGYSTEGREITAYAYGTGKTNLAFIGGIHGGYEWNSVLLAYKLMDYLNANLSTIPKNLTIFVIPSANPDAVHKVTGKEGRFVTSDVTKNEDILTSARFNAHNVDLNRNFDCKWQPESTWRNKTVSAGAAPFSEQEAKAIKNFVQDHPLQVAVFWHSQANGVYASKCDSDILPETLNVMNIYAKSSGYPAFKTFDAYTTTGAADDWLSSLKIPAITVELSTHETIEWEKNLAGVQALIEHYKEQ